MSRTALKQESSIHCDKLVSLAKSSLSHFVGALSERTVEALNPALRVALELPDFARYSQASAR